MSMDCDQKGLEAVWELHLEGCPVCWTCCNPADEYARAQTYDWLLWEKQPRR